MPTSKVDSQGRVVIPARWREQQGVAPGSELVILEEEGRLIVQTREQAVQEAQAIVRRATRPGVSLVDALLRERRAEVTREKKSAVR
jgi:AbrB family looped-hinge helix DNA binding protein